jgi:hypothetical protein
MTFTSFNVVRWTDVFILGDVVGLQAPSFVDT